MKEAQTKNGSSMVSLVVGTGDWLPCWLEEVWDGKKPESTENCNCFRNARNGPARRAKKTKRRKKEIVFRRIGEGQVPGKRAR